MRFLCAGCVTERRHRSSAARQPHVALITSAYLQGATLGPHLLGAGLRWPCASLRQSCLGAAGTATFRDFLCAAHLPSHLTRCWFVQASLTPHTWRTWAAVCCFQSGCWLLADFHNLPVSASQPQAAAWPCCRCSCQRKAFTSKAPKCKGATGELRAVHRTLVHKCTVHPAASPSLLASGLIQRLTGNPMETCDRQQALTNLVVATRSPPPRHFPLATCTLADAP